jgi:putative salt-induced outer membrane protein YdiY
MKVKLLFMCVCTALATSTQAADKVDEKTWDITSEVGAIITSGNTKTTTLKGAIKAKHHLDNWQNEYKLNGIFKEDEIESDGQKVDKRTNEKYGLSLQGNYKLSTEGSHLFVLGSYVSDYFGAYRNEGLASVGYGLTLLDDENMALSFEIGPGMKWFEYGRGSTDGAGNLIEGQSDSEFVGVAKVNYDWQISDNAKFTQLLAVETGSTNTKSISESALLSKINGSLQMKVAFNITHNSDVDASKENTDTETSLTLVYSF